jgi:hypothetical protein
MKNSRKEIVMQFTAMEALEVIQLRNEQRMVAIMYPTGYNCDLFTEPDHRKDATDNIEDSKTAVGE